MQGQALYRVPEYYERIGLLANPVRTMSGYRDDDDDDAARLLFISRARRMGLRCDQIGNLLPIWAAPTAYLGCANCAATRERVSHVIDDKQAEIAERIAELRSFSPQLKAVRTAWNKAPPPAACCTDLSCCVPESAGGPVAIELAPRRRDTPPAQAP